MFISKEYQLQVLGDALSVVYAQILLLVSRGGVIENSTLLQISRISLYVKSDVAEIELIIDEVRELTESMQYLNEEINTQSICRFIEAYDNSQK
jgi:hypothetical protein